MPKIYNLTVLNAGPFAPRSHVRLHVYNDNPDRLPVVLVSEPANNPGMSVTNMAEQLRKQVMQDFPGLGPEESIWLEHYPPRYNEPASFDRITFPSGRASWQRITTEEVIELLGELPPYYG